MSVPVLIWPIQVVRTWTVGSTVRPVPIIRSSVRVPIIRPVPVVVWAIPGCTVRCAVRSVPCVGSIRAFRTITILVGPILLVRAVAPVIVWRSVGIRPTPILIGAIPILIWTVRPVPAVLLVGSIPALVRSVPAVLLVGSVPILVWSVVGRILGIIGGVWIIRANSSKLRRRPLVGLIR